MFAIIRTGGKQYKVEKGLEIWVEKLEKNEGDSVEFTDVLLVCDQDTLSTGPNLKATVSGKVVKQNRRKKILVFKQRRRKRYRRTKGHRQYYTAVQIDDIRIN
jgi:large subunit ribosomal protein L21